MTTDIPSTPPPTDDGGAAFERAIAAVASAAYDAGSEAATSGASPSALTGRTAVDELRAIHATAVQAADAAGNAWALAEERQPRGVVSAMVADDRLAAAHGRGRDAALAEVDAACSALYDHDGGGRVVMIGQTRARHRGKWHAWPEETYEPPAPDAPTPTAALIAAAATLTAPTPAPALVNGGPPTDALDDGR